MPPKTVQAPEMPAPVEHTNRHRARKRRKRNHEPVSIYLAPQIEPYEISIKPSQPPSAEVDTALGDEDSSQPRITVHVPSTDTMGKGKEKANRKAVDKDKDESYRLRAMKAWETKRNRQKEKFQALEASSSLLGLGWGSGVAMDLSTGMSRSDRGISSAVDPLLDAINMRELPDDLPKDDMLQSLQSYSSRYYTANKLLLEPHRRIRRKIGESQHPTPLVDSPRSSPPLQLADTEEDLGSEYGGSPSQDQHHNDQEFDQDEEDGEQEDGEAPEISNRELDQGPRKRGGQRGKRKLRDMYLAMDGSALLTLGVLLQEQIKYKLRQEGYIPASTLNEEDVESIEETHTAGVGSFAVSDDESEEEGTGSSVDDDDDDDDE